MKIAEGGINSIVEELRNLKELAINSANDTNTDLDRLTIQKVFTQKKLNINDIATETNYNTKRLLDGSFGNSVTTIVEKGIVPGNVIMIRNGDYNINSDGVYMLAKGFTGTVNVNAEDVMITQEDTLTPLRNVHVVTSSEGNTNLAIHNLNIDNETGDKSIIKFQGTNNVLNFSGTNTLTNGAEYLQNDLNFNGAVINIGNGLTMEGESDAVLKIRNHENLNDNIQGTSAGIGLDEGESKPDSYIIINSGNFDITIDYDGAAIGTNNSCAIGEITINGGTFNLNTCKGAGIGTGAGGGSIKKIAIGEAVINAVSTNGGAGIGGGTDDSDDAEIGEIIIGDGAKITAVSTYGSGIGAGREHNVDKLVISPAADIYSRGYNGRFFDENTSLTDMRNQNLCDGEIGIVKEILKQYVSIKNIPKNIDTVFNPLKIHHGTKANQAINFFINDMHTKSLGIDRVKVTTRENATSAIGIIDGAIDYALNEATRIGSYLQRFDYTDSNLVTMNENVQAAESAIRDADMAKEMTEYTKMNVLSQSAQAMLAQANQNGSQVLSLLQ